MAKPLDAMPNIYRRAAQRLPSELDRAAQRAALALQRQARINASGRPGPRVQTGTLRRSITVGPLQRTQQGRRVDVYPTVAYGRRVELGHTGAERVSAHTRRPPVRGGRGIQARQTSRARALRDGTVGLVHVRAHTRNISQPGYPYMRPAAAYVGRVVLPVEVRAAVGRAMR